MMPCALARGCSSQPGLWLALVGACGWLLSAGPAAAQQSSVLSRPQVSRIVDALEAQCERLSEDAEIFLDRARRWRPVGADADFWSEVRALEDGADLLQNAGRFGAFRGIERDVRELLGHGAALEQLLERVRPSGTVQSDWQEVRRSLVNLARSFGYDYERDILRSQGRGRPGERLRDPTAGRERSSEPGVERRYSSSDRQTVGAALDRIYDLAEQLASGLLLAGYSDSDNALQNLGEGLLRGAARNAGVEDPRRAQLESTAQSFRKIAREAAASFRRSGKVAEARASAVTLLRSGSNLKEELRVNPTSRNVARTWSDLMGELNRLAQVYELTPLRPRP